MTDHTDELAGLPEDVADAIAALDESTAPITHAGRQWYATIRAELLRLAGENAELRTVNAALENAERRYERAEAELAATMERITAHGFAGGPSLDACVDAIAHELAALKQRIAESQVCGVVAVGGGGASLSHEPYDSLIGQRVALLPVGGETK
jgi:hypothetical protein